DPSVRAASWGSPRGPLLAWEPGAHTEVGRAARRGPWNGGTLATAGGLVFQGTVDGRFLAMNATSGHELWSYDNQAATLAGPISYEVDGEQYVAVLGGYGSVFFLVAGFFAPNEGAPVSGRVYAFKVGGTAARPEIALTRRPTPPPPVIATTAADAARGAQLYRDSCLVCHGVAAIAGAVIPDLRTSPRLQDAGAWNRAVVDGEFVPLGMPRFAAYLTPADVELIRAYVARQAALLHAQERAKPPTQPRG
ncbi:MAG: c-type cytochrome, partial [Gemmatimonadaceae bacterium]